MTRERIFFLVRYIISGLTTIAIQTLTLYVWVSVLQLKSLYLLGVVIGFFLALIAGFTLQKYWTFKETHHHRVHKQVVWYALVALGSLVLNTMLLALARRLFTVLGLNFFHIWYLIAQVGILLGLAGLAFIINTLVTFRS